MSRISTSWHVKISKIEAKLEKAGVFYRLFDIRLQGRIH